MEPALLDRALAAIRADSADRDLIRALLEAGWDLYVDADGTIRDAPPTPLVVLASPSGRYHAQVTDAGVLELVDTTNVRHPVKWSSFAEVDRY